MPEDRWPVTRGSIIERLQNPEDQEAWELAVEIYSPPVFQYCLSKGLQREDALDGSQEVLAKLQRCQYDPERGKFRAWLGTVTRNQVNLFWRKNKTGTDLDEVPDMAAGADLDWERISNAHILNAALNRIRPEFSDSQWQAFEQVALTVRQDGEMKEFVWQKDGSAAEVAEKMNRPVQWVYKTKSEMLKRLREEVIFIAEELTLLNP